MLWEGSDGERVLLIPLWRWEDGYVWRSCWPGYPGAHFTDVLSSECSVLQDVCASQCSSQALTVFSMECGDIYLIELFQFTFHCHKLLAL